MNQTTLAILLRRLYATGPSGFEGLILGLIEDLTGYPLYLARSGDQSGRDMRSARNAGAVIAVECKRYGTDTELDKTELVGKLTEAVTTIPYLDSWVLVASRAVSDQLYTSIERAARELRIEFCIVSDDGTPSTLDVLCANGRSRILDFLRNIDDDERNAWRQSLDCIREFPEYARTLDRLRAELQRSAGYEWWRKESHRWLVERSRTVQSSHAAFGQILNVTGMEDVGRLIRRASAHDALDRWYDDWGHNREGLAITGEEHTESARLERALPFARVHPAQPRLAIPLARDPECVLGTLDVRVAARAGGKRRAVAALHRYDPGVAARHRALAERPRSRPSDIRSATALGGPCCAGASRKVTTAAERGVRADSSFCRKARLTRSARRRRSASPRILRSRA